MVEILDLDDPGAAAQGGGGVGLGLIDFGDAFVLGYEIVSKKSV